MRTIKSKKAFNKVFSDGLRAGTPLVRVRVLFDDDCPLGEVSFVAAKRLGNAVYRNRCKRLLKEAARIQGLPFKNTRTLLFATQETHDARLLDISSALNKALSKAGL